MLTIRLAASIALAVAAQVGPRPSPSPSDLQAESQALLDEAKKVKYYPVLRVGLGYRF